MKIVINNKRITPEAIFIDLDGTLLDLKGHKMSDRNKKAVLIENKKTPFFIATGRSYSNTVKTIMQELNIEYAICQNGAITVSKTGRIISELNIDKEFVIKICEFAKKNKLVVLLNSEYKLYNNKALLWIPKIFKPSKYPSFKKINYDQNIRKIVLAGKLKKKMLRHFSKLKQEVPILSYSLSGNDYIIEITHYHANKGIAAQQLCNMLSIDHTKTIHIGDSLNDASSAKRLGALIAMKGSSKHLLKYATHIATENDKFGVESILNGKFVPNLQNNTSLKKG